MTQRKTLWLSLLLLIGASLSIILMLSRGKSNANEKSPDGVNAFMIAPSYKEFNKSGQLHSQLKAKEMEHYARDDTSMFTQPRMLIYTDDRIPWHISSECGKSQKGVNTVLLYSNVVLHQPAQPDHPETTIRTSELTIHPKRSLAETDKEVEIQQPGSTVHGKGIKANFKKGTIELLKQSRGTYEPAVNGH